MPTLIARVDADIKERFKKTAKACGKTESEFLREVVRAATGEIPVTAQPLQAAQSVPSAVIAADQAEPLKHPDLTSKIEPDPCDADIRAMTIRLPEFLKKAVRQRAKARRLSAGRWIASLVQSNLMRRPVLIDRELQILQTSNRELAAIGRNINQMARNLNEDLSRTEQVTIEKLVELSQAIEANRSAIRKLVRASQNVWGVES